MVVDAIKIANDESVMGNYWLVMLNNSGFDELSTMLRL